MSRAVSSIHAHPKFSARGEFFFYKHCFARSSGHASTPMKALPCQMVLGTQEVSGGEKGRRISKR